MSIKLIAMDMDDTLLNERQQITSRTREAISRAMRAGVAVTIATGRMFCSALPFARDLGLKLPLITYNGAMVREIESGLTLFHRPIPVKTAQAVAELFREQGWYLQKYVDDVLYVAELDENALYYANYAGVEAVAVGERFYDMAEAPTKMLSMGERPLLSQISAALAEQWNGSLYTASSKTRYLEMVDSGVNKGEALAHLAASLGVRQSEVLAMGDSMNDVDMLEYAGIGVAMGNAGELVRAAADFVTASNSEDGVAVAIERFVLK